MSRKTLTAKDVRDRTDAELRALVHEVEQDLFEHEVARVTSRMQDTSVIKGSRRELARVRTILRARELGKEASVSDEKD
ncbi:MAG: 50S ribosomal protein L29 [Deltaproteobacteria bacterium]|nr:50S ribosomal protein L29 [Deltaproteobacteria bacterium]